MANLTERDPVTGTTEDPNNPLGRAGYDGPASNWDRQREIDDFDRVQVPQSYDDGDIEVEDGGSATPRQIADTATEALLYQNAPKGSWLRGVQAKVRLLRQKGFQLKKDPLSTLTKEPLSPEAQLKQDQAVMSRYGNYKQKLREQGYNPDNPSSLPRAEREKYTRLQSRVEQAGERLSPRIQDDLARRGVKAGAQEATKQGLRGVERKAVDAAGKKIATHAAQEAGKAAVKQAAVKTAASTGAKALASAAVGAATGGVSLAVQAAVMVAVPLIKKYGKYIAAFIAFILLLPALVLMLNVGTQGTPTNPSTPSHFSQIRTASAFAGKEDAKIEELLDLIKKEKERYAVVQSWVDRTDSGRSAEVRQKIAELTADMDAIAVEASPERRRDLIKAVRDKQLAFEATLNSTGQAIAETAKKYVGTTTVPDEDGKNAFSCNVATRSCASFVSTVLKEAGVSNSFSATTTGVWHNPAGRTIIERGGALNLSLLQPGDVVFFGSGTTAKYTGALFNHVGIYVGEGMIVDTSSSERKVKLRSINVHQGNWAFNGAKRFGR